MNLGRTISIGSKATKSAMDKAEGVALGMSRRSNSVREISRSSAQRSGIVGRLTTGASRGSLAGLDASKSARLVGNNSGYNNVANQTARYAKKPAQAIDINLNYSYNKSNSRIFYTNVPNKKHKNSMSILNGLMK